MSLGIEDIKKLLGMNKPSGKTAMETLADKDPYDPMKMPEFHKAYNDALQGIRQATPGSFDSDQARRQLSMLADYDTKARQQTAQQAAIQGAGGGFFPGGLSKSDPALYEELVRSINGLGEGLTTRPTGDPVKDAIAEAVKKMKG